MFFRGRDLAQLRLIPSTPEAYFPPSFLCVPSCPLWLMKCKCQKPQRTLRSTRELNQSLSSSLLETRFISAIMASAAHSAALTWPGLGPRSKALIPAKPSIIRSRAGPSRRISLSRATTFSAVNSCCTNSGTTSFPAIKFTMAKCGTLIRGRPRKYVSGDTR